jgi:hypothetical protein
MKANYGHLPLKAEFYRLAENGHYQLATPDANGRYASTQLPGFWLQIDWLWQEPLPRVLTLLPAQNI